MDSGGCSSGGNFFFFLFQWLVVYKCPTNGRSFHFWSEYSCFYPLFSKPHVQPRKLMFALAGQFESARYSNRKNAMTVDDPSVIFNFECYEIEDDSDLIGDSRSEQFITTFFYYRQQWSVCENRYNVLMAENILHRLIEE